MAWMTQELKNKMTPAIKAVLKKYGVKGTVSVHESRTLVVTLKSGSLDIVGDMNKNRNPDFHKMFEAGSSLHNCDTSHRSNISEPTKNFIRELDEAMHSVGYYNNNNVYTDYFDEAYYTEIKTTDRKGQKYTYTGA